MSELTSDSRGILYPAQLPTFRRVPVEGELAAFVRWFWIPEWVIEPGRTSRQHVIGYPACNFVVEHTKTGIAGPTTRASHRDLVGTGWAVGALLRPAAVPGLVGDPAALIDQYRQVELPDLAQPIAEVMNQAGASQDRHGDVIAIFTDWLMKRLDPPTDEGLLANRMVEVAETDSAVKNLTDLAELLHVSPRTLQRLAAKYIGLAPTALIRRRRLQEAADRLRAHPESDLTELAREFGYSDHAHFTNDFRTTLGFTPSDYRRGS